MNKNAGGEGARYILVDIYAPVSINFTLYAGCAFVCALRAAPHPQR